MRAKLKRKKTKRNTDIRVLKKMIKEGHIENIHKQTLKVLV